MTDRDLPLRLPRTRWIVTPSKRKSVMRAAKTRPESLQ
jgi:hypothetical protein